MKTLPVSERQKSYEGKCRQIADDLLVAIRRLPMPESLLAMGNLTDLFACIHDAYNNGRADEREGKTL